MTPAEWTDWKAVAKAEGNRARWSLMGSMWAGAFTGALVLGLLAYFDVNLKWLIVVGYAQGVFALGAMLNQIGGQNEERLSRIESLSWAAHEKGR